MKQKFTGKEWAAEITKCFLRYTLFFALPVLLILAFIYGSKAVRFLIVKPKCTESTEATVVYYENVLMSQIAVGQTAYTAVLLDGGDEVKLQGLYGKRKGDVLELHYNPDNMKQFYIREIRYAPEPESSPKNGFDAFDAVMDAVSNILLIAVAAAGYGLFIYITAEDNLKKKHIDDKGENT